ncbi:hypothetical protein VNO77_06714 [Canavalia gladiata]|uniref:Uncharacterized protein n=1 Tax=Canavalia gladiata TaxID=3824 RepID=A0AAN9QVR9_CANGL
MNLERLMHGSKARPHGSLAATAVKASIGHAAGQGDPYAVVRVAFIAPSHQVALYAPQLGPCFEEKTRGKFSEMHFHYHLHNQIVFYATRHRAKIHH